MSCAGRAEHAELLWAHASACSCAPVNSWYGRYSDRCLCCAASSQLRTILASDNNLTGPFPTSLGQLQYLQELHLDNNALTGTMPPASPGILWLSLHSYVT